MFAIRITIIYFASVFSLMSLVSEMLAWLNSNSRAVQTIATVVLVLVTWRYVVLTRKMIEETRKEKEAPRIQELVNLVMNPIKNIAKSNLEELNKRNYGVQLFQTRNKNSNAPTIQTRPISFRKVI